MTSNQQNLKLKSDRLYLKLASLRDSLIKKYEANGTISYDEAIGLARRDDNGQLVYTAPDDKPTLTEFTEYDEDGYQVGRPVERFNLENTLKNCVIDGEQLSMMEAFAVRARNKVVTVAGKNDIAHKIGTFVIGDVPCLVRLENDLNWWPSKLAPAWDTNAINLTGTGETRVPARRGKSKFVVPYVPRVGHELNDRSIWGLYEGKAAGPFPDKQNKFGYNNMFMFWGNNQVLDLNGHVVHFSEAPSRFAGFQSLVNLGDGSFNHNTKFGATNFSLYCSKGGLGTLGRSNHFSVRAHKSRNILVDNINIGDGKTKRSGPYFGGGIHNESSNIVWKNVRQKNMNNRVTLSATGLLARGEQVLIENLLGLLETPESWNANSHKYPWLQWLDDTDNDSPTYQAFGGKQTLRPVISSAIVSPSHLRTSLEAMQASYNQLVKNYDDVYMQTHHLFSTEKDNDENGMFTPNLVFANPHNGDEGNQYGDSLSYGFRAGGAASSTGNLATEPSTEKTHDIYLIDCSFNDHALTPLETIHMTHIVQGEDGPEYSVMRSATGAAVDMFGPSNSFNPLKGLALSCMHLAGDTTAKVCGYESAAHMLQSTAPYTMPNTVDVNGQQVVLSTAQMAVNNMTDGENNWSLDNSDGLPSPFGLYKGNDLSEAVLAAVDAAKNLMIEYPGAAGTLMGTLGGTKIDAGILAWRKSMMKHAGLLTGCHIGLYGGPDGDIKDSDDMLTAVNTSTAHKRDGQLFPYAVKKDDGSVIDKDRLLIVLPGTDGKAIYSYANLEGQRRYLASQIPSPSSTLYKFKLVVDESIENSGTNRPALALRLVKSDDSGDVSWREAIKTLYGMPEGTDDTTLESFNLTDGHNLSEPVQYSLFTGVDSQNHTAKGMFFTRFDNITNFGVFDCNMSIMESTSLPGEKHVVGDALVERLSQDADPLRPGSHVNDVHAVSINGCQNGAVSGCHIKELHSAGSVYGIEVQGKSDNIEISKNNIENLNANDVETSEYWTGKPSPFQFPIGDYSAYGIRVAENCINCKVNGNHVKNVNNFSGGRKLKLQIESEDCVLSK